jgi:hypothetical protein
VSGRNGRGVRKEGGCQEVTGRGSLGVRGVKRKCQGVHRRRLGLFRVDSQDVRKLKEGRQGICRRLQGGLRADQWTSGNEGGRQGICRRLLGDLRAAQGTSGKGGGGGPLRGEVLEVDYGMVVDEVDRDEVLNG